MKRDTKTWIGTLGYGEWERDSLKWAMVDVGTLGHKDWERSTGTLGEGHKDMHNSRGTPRHGHWERVTRTMDTESGTLRD